jgi:hypothetical protein
VEDVRKHDQLDWKKKQALGMKNSGRKGGGKTKEIETLKLALPAQEVASTIKRQHR